MAASSTLHRTLEYISKFKGENYWEWRDKLREAITLYSDDMVDLLDGTPCPPATGANANAAGVIAWTKLNSKLYNILFFAIEGSATITVKQFQARPQARQKADGVGAWEALSVRFDGITKEARRACREKLTHASMKSGEDPTDFFAKLDEQRLRLADMGETLTNESYEDIILRALPKDYDFVRQQSHMNRTFGLAGIKTTSINIFIDDLSRKSSASAVAGRGVAIQATQGHGKKQHYKRGKDNKKRGGGASKWCSFNRTRTHSEAECKKQQELKGKPSEMANFADIGSAHLAAEQGPPPAFGFSYAAIGPSSGETNAAAPAASTEPETAGPSSIQLGPSQAARGQDEHVPFDLFGAFGTSFMVASTPLQCMDNSLNGSSITVMMVDSGSSEHFLDPFLIPGLPNRMMDYKALDEPHKIFTAGDHVLEGMGTGTVHGTVKDGHGRKTAINFSAFVVPGLGRNLFSVHTAVTKGVVTVFDSVNPRFEIGNTVIPLKPPSPPNNLYSFSMDFASTVDAAGMAYGQSLLHSGIVELVT